MAEQSFLLLSAIAVVAFLLVVYPYAIYPLILRFLRTAPVASKLGYKSTATLLFCAFNEERALPEKLANLEMLKARHPELEILAFDDGSQDRTFDILSSKPDLLTVVRGPGRSGKAHGMKLLASKATGDIIVFTDANVTLRDDAISNLMTYFVDHAVGGICGKLIYLGKEATSTAQAGGLYWKLEEYLKSEESRSGNVMGADGSIFAIRRSLYPSFPDTVLDDLTVSMAVVFNRKRLIKADDVIAFEKLVCAQQDEFKRKVRISARAYHTHLFLKPQLKRMAPVDKFKYFSRKVVRWFGGAFLILGTICGLAAAAHISWLLFALGVLVLALFGIAAKLRRGIVATMAEIILAMLATLIGIWRAMRGQTVVTWNPAQSR